MPLFLLCRGSARTFTPVLDLNAKQRPFMKKTELGGEVPSACCLGGGVPKRMMSNSVPESEKEILTGCVAFYTQRFDVCVCIRVRGLHLVSFFTS